MTESDSSSGQRKLACVMFTDLIGYTALTQSNEDQTLKLLERHNHFLRPLFQKRNGKEIKTIGDSFLVEFESALDATLCSVEIQEFLHEYNDSSLDDWKINLRIGIHLGDVVHKEGDLFGDAVNIASRIQSLAEAGGICLTRQVYDQVHNKVRIPIESIGRIPLKNVSQAIEVFKVVMPWDESSNNLDQTLSDTNPLLDQEKPFEIGKRIAVLPFTNMSSDPNDAYLSDGLTEELIDRLSQVRGLEVIARTSVMSYKNKDKKISEIGKELRVGSIVEGSVRKIGNKIRATVSLVDVQTESHLWTSRYDKDLDDIFAIQSDIASNVTASVPASLGLSRPRLHAETNDILAYTYFLQGKQLLHESVQATTNDALELFEKAIQIDPNFAKAYVEKANCYRYFSYYAQIPFMEAIEKARALLEKALSLDDSLAEAHSALSAVEMMEDDLSASEREARLATEINPNLADAYSNLAATMIARGVLNESIRLREIAYRLDPLEQWNMISLGDEYFWAGRESEALEIWEIAAKFGPYSANDSRMDYYISKKDNESAEKTLQLLQKLEPESIENEFWKGYLAALRGDRTKALQSIEALRKTSDEGNVTINGIALIYCALGDLDSFFEVAQNAIETHRINISAMRFSPLAARAREDSRMAKLLARFDK